MKTCAKLVSERVCGKVPGPQAGTCGRVRECAVCVWAHVGGLESVLCECLWPYWWATGEQPAWPSPSFFCLRLEGQSSATDE